MVLLEWFDTLVTFLLKGTVKGSLTGGVNSWGGEAPGKRSHFPKTLWTQSAPDTHRTH